YQSERGGGGSCHPRGKQRQCAIRLPDNKMLSTSKLLAGEYSDQRSTSGMERVDDLDLKSQTPGILTLVRPAPAKATSRQPSCSPTSREDGARHDRRQSGEPGLCVAEIRVQGISPDGLAAGLAEPQDRLAGAATLRAGDVDAALRLAPHARGSRLSSLYG